MKIYPTEFEVLDDTKDTVAIFKAFDGESLEIELKQSIWLPEELRKLVDAYEYATAELINGKEI